MTISAGDTVTWQNENNKDVVLTFQEVGTRNFITSDIIPTAGTWSYTFTESGEYEFWTIGYAPRATIIVE